MGANPPIFPLTPPICSGTNEDVAIAYGLAPKAVQNGMPRPVDGGRIRMGQKQRQVDAAPNVVRFLSISVSRRRKSAAVGLSNQWSGF